MHSFYGHTLPYIPGKTWDNGLEFLAGSLYFSDYCLIVNQLGLRFTDESVGCIDEHNAERGCQPAERALLRHLRRANPTRAHRRRPHRHSRHRGDPRCPPKVENSCATSARRSSPRTTPVELAAAMEAESASRPRILADTLRTFNGTHRPDRRARPAPPPRPRADRRGPAARGRLRRRHHLHDGRSTRRAPTCACSDGAYAAGADAGNVFEDVYGGGLGWAAVSGRRAGQRRRRARRGEGRGRGIGRA